MKVSLLCLALFVTASALAQTLVGIPHGPADPEGDGICNYEVNPGCADKAVFNTSTFDTTYGRWHYYSAQSSRILVNVRRDSNGDGTLDAWRWPVSKVTFDMGAGSTVALGSVLSKNSGTYFNPATGLRYRRVMYFIYQGPNDNAAGHLCLSYSNDTAGASGWTAPIAAIFSNSAQQRGLPCSVANGLVKAESASAFHSSATDIHLFALQGDMQALTNAVGTTRTETWYTRQNVDTPDVLQLVGEVTSNGMPQVTPTVEPGGSKDYFFRNLDVAYEPGTGRVYLLRVTPYPYAPNDSNLLCTGVCGNGIATFPLRGQIYTMNVGSNIALTTSSASSWSLLADIGSGHGWRVRTNGVCNAYPTQLPSQQNFGIDLDSLTIHRWPDGTLWKSNSSVLLFMGGWTTSNRKASCTDIENSNSNETWKDAHLYQMTYPV